VTPGLAAFLLALLAAYGVFLVYTAVVFRWTGVGVSPGVRGRRRRQSLDEFLVQAGLENVRVVEFVAVEVVLFLVAAAFGWAIYGGVSCRWPSGPSPPRCRSPRRAPVAGPGASSPARPGRG
jgi:hypothetical protein